MLARIVSSFLLLAMIIPVATNQSNIQAASNTTITSFVTSTNTFVQTLVSSYAVGTSYETLTTSDTIYSRTIHMDGPGDGYCNIRWLSFSGKKGQHLSVQIQSTVATYYFVMTEDSFQKWPREHCDVNIPIVDKQKEIKSYSRDLILRSDGDYRFVFELWDTADSTDIQFTSSLYPLIITSASTSYSVSAETRTLSSTVSGSTVVVKQVQEPMSIGGATAGAIVVIVLIVLVAGAFLSYRNRSGKKMKGMEPTAVGSGQFCMKCGTELIRNSKFCRKCGEPAPSM